MATIENGDLPFFWDNIMDAPEKVMGKFRFCGRFETGDIYIERRRAVENSRCRPVFSGGVHALQNNEKLAVRFAVKAVG